MLLWLRLSLLTMLRLAAAAGSILFSDRKSTFHFGKLTWLNRLALRKGYASEEALSDRYLR
jgi:hypothetical protein